MATPDMVFVVYSQNSIGMLVVVNCGVYQRIFLSKSVNMIQKMCLKFVRLLRENKEGKRKGILNQHKFPQKLLTKYNITYLNSLLPVEKVLITEFKMKWNAANMLYMWSP